MSLDPALRRMHAARTLAIFREYEAIVEDTHVVYTNPKPEPEGDGDHGSVYFAKDRVTPHVRELDELGSFVAVWCYAEGIRPQTVVSVATGGIAFGQSVARGLIVSGRVSNVPAVFAEKVGEGFAFLREYDRHVTGRDVLVVEDIVTTGGSIERVIDLINRFGGNVVGATCMVDRSGGATAGQLSVPHFSALYTTHEEKYARHACVFCQEGRQINVAVGKGDAFLNRYPDMRHLAPVGWSLRTA